MIIYMSPFQIFLPSTSPSDLVWCLLVTLLHSLQILPGVHVQYLVFMSTVRCSKEAWLDTLTRLAEHVKAFSATVSGKGEWLITQHDTMFFMYVKWEILDSLQREYLSMEISLLTSKFMKLFELWWRCGRKGKYDFVFMLFNYISFFISFIALKYLIHLPPNDTAGMNIVYNLFATLKVWKYPLAISYD